MIRRVALLAACASLALPGMSAATVAMTESITQMVTNASPSLPGTVSLVASPRTLYSGQQVAGTVTFELSDGSVLPGCEVVVVTSGTALCSVQLTTPGVYDVVARYNGDGFTLPSVSPVVRQVIVAEKTTPTVQLDISRNPALIDVGFNYTAYVNGPAGAATGGTVTFRVGGAVVCSNRVVFNGIATCVLTPGTAQRYTVQAEYSGNSGYTGAFSGILSHLVVIPTTTAVTSDAKPVMYPRPSILKATVSTAYGTAPGSVMFTDANNVPVAGCTSVPLVNGAASCPVGSLPEGSNVFIAYYRPSDELYQESFATFNQTVAHSPRKRVDFNGDRGADILWKHADGRQAMWMMDGIKVVDSFAMIGPGTGWSVSQVGDFNGDGKSDILWVHTDGASALWLIDGHTQIGGGRLFAGGSGWSPAAVADLNGDGKSDIVWTHTDGSIAVWIMDGFKQVGGARLLGPGTGWVLKRVQDFDTDLKADLLLEHADGRSKVVLLDGASGRGEFTLNSAGSGWSINGWSRVGDTSQVYSRHTDGRVMITYINGRVLDTMTWEPQTWTPSLTAVLSGAGSPEMLRQYPDGSLHAFYGDAIPANSPYTLLRLADFNKDGIADVLALHTDGSVAMRMGGMGWGPFVTVLGPGTGWAPYFIDDDWSEWIARH